VHHQLEAEVLAEEDEEERRRPLTLSSRSLSGCTQEHLIDSWERESRPIRRPLRSSTGPATERVL